MIVIEVEINKPDDQISKNIIAELVAALQETAEKIIDNTTVYATYRGEE